MTFGELAVHYITCYLRLMGSMLNGVEMPVFTKKKTVFFALQRLHGAQFDRRYDSSSMGPGDDVESPIGGGGEVNTGQNEAFYEENLIEVRKVKNLSMGYFVKN